MYIKVGKKVFEKDVVAAFLSFFAGAVSTAGLVFNIIYFWSWIFVVGQFMKLTCQSNLLSFIVSWLYLVNPNSKIFKTNFWPLISVCLLWFAGLGFWFILFPIYWMDLGNFLFAPTDMHFQKLAVFFAIWNHLITQIFCLVFFYHINKKKNIWNLDPMSTRTMLNVSYSYLFFWMFLNIFLSWKDEIFPTYGIFTNFNPYRAIDTDLSKSASLFSIRALLYSHLSCALLIFLIVVCFSSASIKFRIANYHSCANEIVKVPNRNLADAFCLS